MQYSIIIPTYNNCDQFLKPCIKSILKYTNINNLEIIVSANGCVDNTKIYLEYLTRYFEYLNIARHFTYVWNESALGYPKATNEGIKRAIGEKIILLNNDTTLLEQPQYQWINFLEAPFNTTSSCGILTPILSYSPEAGHWFAVFFCVMIDRQVFDKIGLLNEDYGIGYGEDIEFCIEAARAGFSIIECAEKFDWKNSQKISYGFIAQDIEKILPEIVTEVNGKKTISYQQIIPLLVEYVKDLKKQIASIKR